MSNLKSSNLNEKYAVHILVYLLEKGEIPISGLIPDVTKSYRMIRSLVEKMDEEGLVKLDKQYSPRKKFTVKLTDKGERVAHKLIEIEEIMEE